MDNNNIPSETSHFWPRSRSNSFDFDFLRLHNPSACHEKRDPPASRVIEFARFGPQGVSVSFDGVFLGVLFPSARLFGGRVEQYKGTGDASHWRLRRGRARKRSEYEDKAGQLIALFMVQAHRGLPL